MDSYNIDKYISKFKPSQIEFKILQVIESTGMHYIVKFLKEIDKPFRRHKQVWNTLCYANGHSQGFDWATKEFTTIENAEAEINRLTQLTKVQEVRNFVKEIK